MKLYEVIKTFDVEASDRDNKYTLFLYKGALILHLDDIPMPYFQTTIFERIFEESIEESVNCLEEIEVPKVDNILKHVAYHNAQHDVTYAKFGRLV